MENISAPNSPNLQPRPLEIDRAADRLADLLAETVEVRELIRLAQELKADPDVHRLSQGIKDLQAAEGGNKQPLLDALRDQRESLLVVKNYRQAEVAVKALFCATDQIISSAAGLNFSENARVNIDLWSR